MATPNIIADPAEPAAAAAHPPAPLLVSLSSLPHEALDQVIANLLLAFPTQSVLVATPDAAPSEGQPSQHLRVISFTPAAPLTGTWTLTAADFQNAHQLLAEHKAQALLLLGSEAQSLQPAALQNLVSSVLDTRCDLAVARYTLPPRAGLLNSAILYPLTRALFATRPRFPLAIDLCLSPRMTERLATTAQRFTSANQLDALVWPVSEAVAANYSVGEADAGTRTLPQPSVPDLNSLLAQITGSLFADLDAKAAVWQRARPVQPRRAKAAPLPEDVPLAPEDVAPMIESFRLAYGNLSEIWSLVLPPHSLLGLKRLSVMPPETFSMPDALWARIVFDFLLAFRLRTINRGHLLGALTPLYLAWVASHILLTSKGTPPEQHVEAVAAALEADKPYLVSRWRWPDRFNP